MRSGGIVRSSNIKSKIDPNLVLKTQTLLERYKESPYLLPNEKKWLEMEYGKIESNRFIATNYPHFKVILERLEKTLESRASIATGIKNAVGNNDWAKAKQFVKSMLCDDAEYDKLEDKAKGDQRTQLSLLRDKVIADKKTNAMTPDEWAGAKDLIDSIKYGRPTQQVRSQFFAKPLEESHIREKQDKPEEKNETMTHRSYCLPKINDLIATGKVTGYELEELKTERDWLWDYGDKIRLSAEDKSKFDASMNRLAAKYKIQPESGQQAKQIDPDLFLKVMSRLNDATWNVKDTGLADENALVDARRKLGKMYETLADLCFIGRAEGSEELPKLRQEFLKVEKELLPILARSDAYSNADIAFARKVLGEEMLAAAQEMQRVPTAFKSVISSLYTATWLVESTNADDRELVRDARYELGQLHSVINGMDGLGMKSGELQELKQDFFRIEKSLMPILGAFNAYSDEAAAFARKVLGEEKP
ncbi:MAG: hypothetical protein NT051_01505 [Candidatus Micrarchaeota archaeon]|nr:hypothetical protein [Candidatus Micrarchaeota archaeon]